MKKKLLSAVAVFLILIVAFSGCGKKEMKIFSDIEKKEALKMGNGDNAFYLNVVFENGKESMYEIHTDEETVGDALLSLGLIEGEKGPFGLYIKKVVGVEADFDKTKTYWAFYVNGEYAQKGVDQTKIESQAEYVLKVE